ncbi:juvenile hormone esterase [Papilio machaon]|uniref:juvenile hormone esterase n=1 Tax=Papilio machaon TaxID=76193 RepID=UPI001E66476A|nr:juvenile hormone esterase [Papilio machaon]
MVQVRVKEGMLEGELCEDEIGGTFFSFRGIPYAEPPIGDLRFKPPQPKKAWDGVRDAKKFGPICCQCNLNKEEVAPSASEDCLFLNVYTPDIKPKNALPVMFYIHGGGLVSGSGNDDMYGPEFLVRHDVILVTFNYRLEVLGFLCLDTEDIPGNAGMKDQVAALRWVNENIASFGGDSKNITIFGHSAGGLSVSYHLISPMSKGLFQRAMVMSGSLTCPWGQMFEPRERGLALARKLGCYSEDDKELYEFFKHQPVENLIGMQVPITFSEKGKGLYDLMFGVVDEKQFGNNERFIFGDVIEKLRNGIHEGVELVMGYVEDEGLIHIRIGISLEETCNYANEFREFFVPKLIAHNCTLAQQFEVGRKIKHFYFKDEVVTMDNLKEIVKFNSLHIFTYPMFQLARSCSLKNKVYFYKFTGKTERNFMVRSLSLEKFVGDKIPVCHADEINYIFPMKKENLKINKNAKSFKIINHTTKLFTNFAKYGNPTQEGMFGLQWTPYKMNEQSYLDINENLTIGFKPDKVEVDFWENIFKEYLPKSIPY